MNSALKETTKDAVRIVPLIEQDAIDKQSHWRSPNAYGFLASSE